MNFSTRSKLRREGRINNNFENILSSLSLEEIITLKLELSTPIVKGKLYGTNIYYSLYAICRDAVIKWALTTAPGKKVAADFLGIDYRSFKKLNITHKYFRLLEELEKKKMKISNLVIGEFYIIKPTTKKQVIIEGDSLKLGSFSPIHKENRIYKDSLFIYAGQKTEKVEKRVDSKIKNVYTYKPHIMLCVKTGEKFKVPSYYIQTYFVKPKK